MPPPRSLSAHTPPTRPGPTVEIAILAGGRSSRMGVDKARLRLGPRSLLGHVRQAAAQLGARQILIRRDLQPGLGPLGGIHTALCKTRADFLLLLPCDTPFVTGPFLARFLRAAIRLLRVPGRGTRPRRSSAVFARAGRFRGFPILLDTAARPAVERLMLGSDRSLRALAASLRARSLPLTAAQSRRTRSLDTPHALESARHSWPRPPAGL